MLIRLAKEEDLPNVIDLYRQCKADMDRQEIYQWTDKYPNRQIFIKDIQNKTLFLLFYENDLLGAINISEEQEKEYESLAWEFGDEKVLVIHRLAILPKEQGKGYAQLLMRFAEDFATNNAYQSIRLDVYSKNHRGIKFYQKRAYYVRGEIRFPNREFHFFGMEKRIIN